MVETVLPPGISRAGDGQDGVTWNVLGHTYFLKALSTGCFCFETLDPPGTFVPLHIHPRQDEFIYMLEGTFDLQLGDAKLQARPGDLVRMPMGVPHAYYNDTASATRALFWVSPRAGSRSCSTSCTTSPTLRGRSASRACTRSSCALTRLRAAPLRSRCKRSCNGCSARCSAS